MLKLVAPLAHRGAGGQDPVHRALRAQVPVFIEQRRDHFTWRAVDEARRAQHVKDGHVIEAFKMEKLEPTA